MDIPLAQAEQVGFAFGVILIVVIGVGGTILWIMGLVDAIKVPDDTMYKNGSKTMWILIIVLLGFIGAIIYYAAGRPTPETRARMQAGAHGFPGATAIDFRGVRYALGRTASAYTIWDTAAQNAPIRTYPLTPEGWEQAWQAYYQELEGAPPQPPAR
jgi:hypothetical protein